MVAEGNKRNAMKKTIIFIILLAATISTFAQNDITKFMGIPIDGYKSEMIRKLKEKGFVSTVSDKNVLEGEFNGKDVHVYVGTNNNKVWRIMLCDVNTVGEADIKIRFNNLCEQFKNNRKYLSLGDYTIPEDEDISYEMTVHKKRYEAGFYQEPAAIDSLAIYNDIGEMLSNKYTEKELENPTDDIKAEIAKMSLSYAVDLLSKKSVWFMISEFYGKYYITMYYDNGYNKANGEDL